MKAHQNKQLAGLWMDHHQAILITSDSGKHDYVIQEKVKSETYHGDKSEHTAHNAQRNASKKYFKHVAQLLTGFDEILIFGPGTSQEEFLHFLHEDHQFRDKKITLQSAQHVTDPQMVAAVRDFFRE